MSDLPENYCRNEFCNGCVEVPKSFPASNDFLIYSETCPGSVECIRDLELDVYETPRLIFNSNIDSFFPERTCTYQCCSSSKQSYVTYDSLFQATIDHSIDFYSDWNFKIDRISPTKLPPDLFPWNCTAYRWCKNSIIKNDTIKISINYKDRNSKCGSNKITDIFLDNLGYLPPINGCKVEMLFDFFNNAPTRLVAFLDVNSNNTQYRNFDYYNRNDISQDFKIMENDEYDNNYPKIYLTEYNLYKKSLTFASFQCPTNSLFEFSSYDQKEFVKILSIAVEYIFEIRNGKLYMKPFLYFGLFNNLGRTADVFSSEEIHISEISDFYREITFMPDNRNGRSNNTNCRVKVSLYG